MSDGPVVTARALRTRRGQTEVLHGIDLEVRRGEVLAIVGPSGGGKTTLLRALNYLTPFHAGEVEIAGHRLVPGMSERTDAAVLRAVRTRVGMVFQAFHLFPHLTALGNVTEAPRRVLGLGAAEAEARAQALLARVGLAEHAAAHPHTLSGGQQQRVAIARALAMEPVVLLLDEPTSALDPIATQSIEELVQELKREFTVVIVTHNMQQAARVSDFTAFFYLGELVEHDVTTKMFTAPAEARTEAYVTGRFG